PVPRPASGRLSGGPGPRRMSEVVANPPATAPASAPADSGGHVTATRRLLRRLRGIMAASESAQERLDRSVRVIAAEMVAEGCSAYVMRAGEVLGVLVVQNRTLRHYTEDEVEVLQTIAMIIAELVASGELVNPLEMEESRGGVALPVRLEGIRLNPGLAIGPAVLHEPAVVIRQ